MVADFNKKRNTESSGNKILFQAVGTLVLIILVILIIADFRIYQKKKELISQISSYQKQIADIKKNSQTLKDEIANSDNPNYLEKIAYEQGMVKAGEKEIIFVAPSATPKPGVKTENFWAAALSWIKSKF